MECGKPRMEEDEGGQMVAGELEAAEVLWGLARSSSVRGGEFNPTQPVAVATLSQDQPAEVCYAPSMVKSAEKTEKIVEKLCGTSYQSNTVIKSRRKLTEAEIEERKAQRILANRESARQTIRRRQAMYLELSKKATELLEENEKLKKQKEVAMEEHNVLKVKNEFLKAQLAQIKKAEKGETEEEVKTSCTDKSRPVPTTPPIFLPNQPPPIVPCFWPSIFPSSDVFPFQCPHNTISSQFPYPHQGQEHGIGNTTPGTTPLFVVPVPWLLPLLSHSCSIHSHSDRPNPHQCTKCSCPDPRPHEDNNQTAEPSNPKKTMPTLQVDTTTQVNVISTPESSIQNRNQELVICPRKKPEDAFAASMARRRRKELMKLKNEHCHDVRTSC